MLTIRLLTCATDPAGAPADRAAAAVSGPPWAPIQRPAAPRRARRARKTLRLPRCLRRGGMSDLGRGLDARCQDQFEWLQWRHGPPTHTPCRLRYAVPLSLVAQVPARRVARRETTA